MELVNPMFERAQNKNEIYEQRVIDPEHRSTSKAAWTTPIVLILILLCGCAGYFGYLSLKKRNIQVSQLFNGNQTRIDAIDQRIVSTEGKLRDLSSGWNGVAQRVTALEQFEDKVNHSVGQARQYAQNLTDRVHQQITAELNARTAVLDARLEQVESEQKAEQARLAQSESELRQEIASVGDQTNRGFTVVRQEADNNARDIGSLSQRLDRKRVDFEVAKGRSTELVPGVSLQINHTNREYQRFRGSLWLLQDRRTMWLHDEGVNQPVRFYYKEGGDPCELIVTDVTQRSVIGYLLVPVQPSASVNAAVNDAPAVSLPGGD